jgi:type I restriction enzyme M protein
MPQTKNIEVGELFTPVRGKSIYTRAYGDKNAGEYPVYSASLTAPLCFINSYDFDGEYLTWTANGYGGRLQIISGKFSVNGDRGVLVPKMIVPPLYYLKHILEPTLISAAVGRVVEGRRNDYTKVGPKVVEQAILTLPITPGGKLDFPKMIETADKVSAIERLQEGMKRHLEEIDETEVYIPLTGKYVSVSLGDANLFSMEIGERLLRDEGLTEGIPIYSAHVFKPFAFVKTTNLSSFDRDSILWSIDNANFDWNIIPKGIVFATTDHCGRLQAKTDDLDPEYIYHFLQATRAQYGFDWSFRSSMGTMRALVTVDIPLDAKGKFDRAAQRALAKRYRQLAALKRDTILILSQLAKAKPILAV